jgi:hypothetical protein
MLTEATPMAAASMSLCTGASMRSSTCDQATGWVSISLL